MTESAIGGIYYPIEGKANPLLAAPSFAAAAMRAGATILTHTALTGLAVRTGGGFDAATTRGQIRARRVVDCAGAEAGAIARMVGLELPIEAYPIQTSVTEPTAPLVRHLLYAAGEKLSLKQNRRGQLLIGGGWDARLDGAGRPVADMNSLVGNMQVRSGRAGLANVAILRTWAAIVNGTADWKPLLGEAPRRPASSSASFHGWASPPVRSSPAPSAIWCWAASPRWTSAPS